MRIPDPKANTTTEAYLAYKAGYLEESELKPKLYEPYLHFDAWLAYWAGLTNSYPGKKSLFYGEPVIQYGITGSLSKDGVVSVVGTATTTDGVRVIRNDDFSLEAGTYTLSISEPQTSVVNLLVNTNNGLSVSFRISAGSTSATNTIPDGSIGVAMGLFYGVIKDRTYNNSFKIQFIAGDAPDYDSDPYTTNPEMLCDEEALVAYLSGVTDTYPEEIKDPYDVRIVGYLKHLASIRWPEPDYPVNNEEFYLSTMDSTHTSNPVPSSDIELDTAEGKIINVEAYGDTYQQTYSGTNLFNDKTLYSKTISGDVTIIDDNGFTLYDDGTGGGWKNAAFEVSGFTANTDYSMKFNQTNTNPAMAKSWIAIGPGGILNQTYTSGTQVHFNSGENTTLRFLFYAQVGAGSVAENTATVTNVQINVGSSTGAYEPYTGGIPAPSPDYPQPIQVVTGEQTVTVTGKNLFPLGTGSCTDHGITSVYNSDGSITVSGTASATYADLTTSRIVNYEQGKTYTVSITEALPINFGLITLGAGVREDISIAAGTKSGKRTFNYTHNIAKLYIYNLTVGQSYNFTIYPMVEEGSSASSFEPYQTPQSYPISLGSIELCKIGGYQDYIYKSGDDWYVHEVCKSMTLSIASMGNDETYPGWKNLTSLKADLGVLTPSTGNTGHMDGYCPYYTNIKGYVAKDSQANNDAYVSCNFNNNNAILYLQGSVYGLTQTQWKTQYPNLNLELYYVLATPTDTQITDTTLISQLEALARADTYDEKTYIKVTTNEPNLPALLKVEAYKY